MEVLKRKIIDKIDSFMADREIIAIHGSRQVGKTSVMKYVMAHEPVCKNAPAHNVVYFDLEDFNLLQMCDEGVEQVIAYLKSQGADFNTKVFLFIDEIQYMRNPSSFLKLFHDRYENRVKLIVSGSSSMLIKKKFKDSLAGRVIDFELFPLDFDEYLEFKGLKYSLSGDNPDAINNELKKHYEEFVIFGGYPAIVQEPVVEKKEIKLKQIINAYIKKDIRDLAEIRNIDKFNTLVQILSSQTGNLVNIHELSNTAGIAKETLQEYLFLLENTYIVRRISPFSSNRRSELTKMPKLFFEDSGVANVLKHKTFSLEMEGDLLENSVYSELRKNISVDRIHYWRTQNKQEIDFVIEYSESNSSCVAAEVARLATNKHASTLGVFKKQYKKTKLFFCAMEHAEMMRNTDIHLIYPWELKYRIPSN